MGRGSFIVEQIDTFGNVVMDYDQTLSPMELKRYLAYLFHADVTNVIKGVYGGRRYVIYAKNVTYLGNPHPEYKKRIQLGSDMLEVYKEHKAQGEEMIILGVYHYFENYILVDFDIEQYVQNKSHNSSAHVYVEDLQKAVLNGIATKIDYRDNKITAFRPDYVNDFLEDKLGEHKVWTPVDATIECLSEYFRGLPKYWHGVDCYREMINKDFSKKFWGEWQAAYSEMKLQEYIENDNYVQDYMVMYQDRSEGGIDLDIYYPELRTYGDLKMHSENSGAIPGNKYETLLNLIQDHNLYYAIGSHNTIKDSERDFEVCKFINPIKGKQLLSYAQRMKNSIELKEFMILEINRFNYQYLASFQKDFKNSDGKPRTEKFMINKKDIERFTIYKEKL